MENKFTGIMDTKIGWLQRGIMSYILFLMVIIQFYASVKTHKLYIKNAFY